MKIVDLEKAVEFVERTNALPPNRLKRLPSCWDRSSHATTRLKLATRLYQRSPGAGIRKQSPSCLWRIRNRGCSICYPLLPCNCNLYAHISLVCRCPYSLLFHRGRIL